MRFLLKFCICLMIAFSAIGAARAADNFPGAMLTGSNGSFVDNNNSTTGETGEPLTLGGGTLNTQWYSWTATTSGFVSFGTCNPAGSSLTNFDTTLGVYTGNAVNALTQIGFNDDTTGCNSTVDANYSSQVSFNAVAGTVYRIQVDGYGSALGQFNLFYGYSGFTTTPTITGASEAGTTGAFTVVLNALPTGTATITIGTSPQCTFSPTTLTFTTANWNTPQTVSVTAINDAVVEGTHFCAASSITPSGGGVPTSAATPPSITITDNDSATVSIANTTNGAEAGPVNGVMTVTQTAVSISNTVVSYAVTGTASSGTDYTALSGTVTILAGSTTATISIPVINDAIVEGGETVILTLTSISSGLPTLGTPVAATNAIADNDAAAISIANTTNGNEMGPVSGVITVTMTAASATNTVLSYTVSGSATSGADYTALSGTVTVLAGATTATISIPVIDDATLESSETVNVLLTAVTSGLPTLGTPLTATNTILDNDLAAFSISKSVSASNISSPSTLTYTITVQNTGTATLTGPTITDALSQGSALTLTTGPTLTSGDAAPLGVLNVGETWIYTATYAVTQTNINLGTSISNTATFDTAETAPSTSAAAVTTITVSPSLSISKGYTITTDGGTIGRADLGDVITYNYSIQNTGNVTVNNVSVNDVHLGKGTLSSITPASVATLAPGAIATFSSTYITVQGDIDNQ
jgi:uncharacterized repeat protein (TIGR01451 family)